MEVNNKVRWIIQHNLIAENDLNQIQSACDELGVPYINVKIIPFSSVIPKFPTDDEYVNIYYGATTFMNNVYNILDKPKGLFYNHETFSMENYINQWGDYMLNNAAEIMTVEEFINTTNDEDDNKMFIRPDGDGKEFDGQVATVKELKTMVTRMMQYEGPMNMDSKIILAPAYNIKREWRNYIVNGEVVTSSKYRENFRLSKSSLDIPEEMITFVEERCKEYQPHDVFAMDIAEVLYTSEDGKTEEYRYYIIECGCMNSVGFYHCDIFKYVESLTKYVQNG